MIIRWPEPPKAPPSAQESVQLQAQSFPVSALPPAQSQAQFSEACLAPW
jgi:hypothetical protein